MTEQNVAVYGIYSTTPDAEHGVDALMLEGVPARDISVILSDAEGGRGLAHEKHTKAPEGATVGGVTGGALGGTLGLLAGLGSIAIPGVGALIAAGPIMAALAGLGAGGTLGGIVGALVGVGMPEYEARRYDGRLQTGGILLSVHCGTSIDVQTAKDVLERTGASDVSSQTETPAERPPLTTDIPM
ncbi:MAG: hypothetical protein U0Q11_22150 [Vicinamibacterales bacterium]